MFVVCGDHLEDAIDEFLEAYGEAPDVYQLAATSFTAWTPPAKCQFCEDGPVYLVV